MAEKPILFSGEMVRAILNGRKTQTRRVIASLPQDIDVISRGFEPGCWFFGTSDGNGESSYDARGSIVCPYGRPGDLLWVRETWADNIRGCPNGLTYRADHLNPKGDGPAVIKWKPSIFMPRWASRITLRVCDVRVERLQDISDTSILAEGVPQNGRMYDPSGITYSESLRNDFCNLWDSINAKRDYGWAVNPWVWVVEFELWQTPKKEKHE